MGVASGFSIIIMLIYFAFIGIGIYAFILFVKLAHRGIKALDIYIDKNSKDISYKG
ncbi:hypothetical protein OW763_14260 [Clostridium aestuarii]|uniref:Uncharacterized protein n=1 Tax=Clostridium aestuarii TaxID=338193 RepID=A0ABT4D2M5_9CLOT|nr:hypothetical protein [Clostridium aestuarii]MCY6485494.1 hypothetical protein [Clostridium aestuarii]